MKLGLHIAATDREGGPRTLGPKLAELLGQLRWLASLGIETVFGWVVGVDRIKPLEVMRREVIPAVAEL
jgi:hypothetical protein